MNDMPNSLTISNLCACLGPQATDPYCPCSMRRQGLDGFYNCHGDKEAMARREADAQDRLSKAMASMRNRRTP